MVPFERYNNTACGSKGYTVLYLWKGTPYVVNSVVESNIQVAENSSPCASSVHCVFSEK